jgi:hypothetical protein
MRPNPDGFNPPLPIQIQICVNLRESADNFLPLGGLCALAVDIRKIQKKSDKSDISDKPNKPNEGKLELAENKGLARCANARQECLAYQKWGKIERIEQTEPCHAVRCIFTGSRWARQIELEAINKC